MMELLKIKLDTLDIIQGDIVAKMVSNTDYSNFLRTPTKEREIKYPQIYFMDKENNNFNIKKNKILRKIHGVDINATVIDDTPEEHEEELKKIKNKNIDNNDIDNNNNFEGAISNIPLDFLVDKNDNKNIFNNTNEDIVNNNSQENIPMLKQISFSETKILEDQNSYFTNKNLFGSSDFKKMPMGRDIFNYLQQTECETSKSMREGSAIHMYMFEEEKFKETVIGVTGTRGSLEPTEATLLKTEQANEGKIAIGQGLYNMLPSMKEKLFFDEYISELLSNINSKEVGLIGKMSFLDTDGDNTTFDIRCKHDFIVRDEEAKTVLIGDLKTTDKQELMNVIKWKYQIKSMSYDLQAYLYTEMLKDFDRNNGVDVDNYQYSFAHLVLLRKEPFAVRFWTLGKNVLSNGEAKLIDGINTYRQDIDISRGILC